MGSGDAACDAAAANEAGGDCQATTSLSDALQGLSSPGYDGQIIQLRLPSGGNFSDDGASEPYAVTNASSASDIVISADGVGAVFQGSGRRRRRRSLRHRRQLQTNESEAAADDDDDEGGDVEADADAEAEAEAPPLLTIGADAPRVTIRGLRFTRSAGAPALLVLGAHVVIEDCWFDGNAGGALRVEGDSRVELRNTRFDSNGDAEQLDGGGAIAVYGWGASARGRAAGLPRVEATGCSLTRNAARHGGAIDAAEAHVALAATEVSSNTATVRGGALHALDATVLLADASLLVENVAPVGGGASAYVASSSTSPSSSADAIANAAEPFAAWQYALPTPMGYWIANAEQCGLGEPCAAAFDVYYTDPTAGTTEASLGVAASLATVTVANLALGALEDEYPFACPPGTFGASVSQHGQGRRLGEAIAGHWQLVRLHLKAWGYPRYSGGEAHHLRSHQEAVAFQPQAAQVAISLRLTIQVSVSAQTGPSCSGICPAGSYCVAGTAPCQKQGPIGRASQLSHSPLGRGWPKPGAALGLRLPLRAPAGGGSGRGE